jgi:predicted secreted protein
MTPEQEFDMALKVRLLAEYNRGFNRGLGVAMKIRNWLTRHPDQKWQREARELADEEIESAKAELRSE